MELKELGKTARIALTKNTSENNEHEYMVAVQLRDNNITTTDLVFNNEGKLKSIESELSKEELLEVLQGIVEEYYKEY